MLKMRKAGHRELERVYSLIEMDFDKREILPNRSVHRGMLRGEQEFWLFYDEASDIIQAYALVMSKNIYGYVLLKYFGVLPWYRGQGIGVEAMRLLNRQYADRQGILAELTVFDPEQQDYLRTLRRFFARFGYVEVQSDYRIGGAEALLMVKPIRGTADIARVAHRILRDFYTRCLSPIAMEKMLDIHPAAVE